MVKHTQTIRPQQPTNCLSVFDSFVGLAFKGLIYFINNILWSICYIYFYLYYYVCYYIGFTQMCQVLDSLLSSMSFTKTSPTISIVFFIFLYFGFGFLLSLLSLLSLAFFSLTCGTLVLCTCGLSVLLLIIVFSLVGFLRFFNLLKRDIFK